MSLTFMDQRDAPWQTRVDRAISYHILTHPLYETDDNIGEVGRNLEWQVQPVGDVAWRTHLSLIFWLRATEADPWTFTSFPVITDKAAWEVTDADIQQMVHRVMGVIHVQRQTARSG